MGKINMNDIKLGLKKYWWIIAIALFIKFTQSDLVTKLETQSIIGGTMGLGIGLSTLLVIIGAIALVFPVTASTAAITVPLGIAIIIGGLILGGGTILSQLITLFTSNFLWVAIIFGIIFLIYMFKK